MMRKLFKKPNKKAESKPTIKEKEVLLNNRYRKLNDKTQKTSFGCSFLVNDTRGNNNM